MKDDVNASIHWAIGDAVSTNVYVGSCSGRRRVECSARQGVMRVRRSRRAR